MNKSKYLDMLDDLKDFLKHSAECQEAVNLLTDEFKKYALSVKSKARHDNSEGQKSFPVPQDLSQDKNSFFLYSDGACRGNPGPGAWGAIVQDYTGKVIYEGRDYQKLTTNNQMELQGATSALEFLLEFIIQNTLDQNLVKAHLYSDSKYVVDGLRSWLQGWKKKGWKKADKRPPENLEYWKRIDKAKGQFDNLNYYWVKGHAGHPQNEYCDMLANQILDKEGY